MFVCRSCALHPVAAFTRLVSTVLIVGCTAEAGPVGPQGPEGPDGPMGEGAVPSISLVSPLNLYLEYEDTLIVSGSSTQWNTNTTLDLGAGITVNRLTVASPSALVAMVEVDSTAELGPRGVVVRSDTDTLTFADAFRVDAPLEVDFIGSLVPGGRISGDVLLRNPEQSFPALGEPFALHTYLSEGGILGSAQPVSAEEMSMLYYLPLNAPPGPTRLVIEEAVAGIKWRSEFFDLPSAAVVPGPYGTSLAGQLTEAGGSATYSIDARAGHMVAIAVDSPSGGFTHGLILPDSSHESIGQTFYAFENRRWFALVYDLRENPSQSLDYTLRIDTLSIAPPTLDTIPTAGSLSGLYLTDVYAVDLAVGQTLTVTLTDGATDSCATIDAAVFVRDPTGRAIRIEIGGCTVLVTDPVAVAGTHTVFVTPNPTCACSFDYEVAARVEG